MKRVLCLVLCVLAATIIITKVSAGGANSTNWLSSSRGRFNAHYLQALRPTPDTRILRVTSSGDAFAALVPQSSSQSINLNSTRFYVYLDGVPTLHDFDSTSPGVRKQGPLFPTAAAELMGPSWPSLRPDLIYGFDSSGLARLCSYDLSTGFVAIIK